MSLSLGLNTVGRTFTGAWIETEFERHRKRCTAVAPLQVRGLKPIVVKDYELGITVAPLQVRGLKQPHYSSSFRCGCVAPLQVRGLKPWTPLIRCV